MKVIRVIQRSIIRNRDRGYDEKVLEITLPDGAITYSNSAWIQGESWLVYSTEGGNFSVRLETHAAIVIDDKVLLKPCCC